MDSNRRKLLVGVPALALTGCATPAFKNAHAVLGPGMIKGAAVPRTPEELLQAAISERIFQHFELKNEVLIPGRQTSFSLRDAKAAYTKAVQAAQKKSMITLVDIGMIGETMLPLLRAMDESGVPSRRISASSTMPTLTDGIIKLPPGGQATVTLRGLCLDRGMPTPREHEPLRLSPIEKFVLPDLVPVMLAVLEYSKKHDPQTGPYLREVVWLLREPGGTQRYANNPHVRAALERAYPGGFALYEKAVRRENMAQPLRSLLAVADGVANMDPSLLSSTAHTFESTDREMHEMSTRVLREPIPQDNSKYSFVENQFAVMGVGRASLVPRFTIINASTQPGSLDLKRYAAISPRNVQRMVMPPPDRLDSAKVYPMRSDSSPLSNDEVKSLSDMFIHDAAQLSPMILGFLTDPNRKTGRWLSQRCRNPATRALFEACPFVGNALSAYSLITGKDWLSGEPLSTAEYLLNAWGTIPGAAQITRLAGNNLPKVVSKMMASPTARAIGSAGNFVATTAEINDKDLVNYFGLEKAKELVSAKIETAYALLA